MKTRNSILALAIVVCTLTCCVQEDPIYTPSFSKVSFEAVHGDAPTSKTFLYTDGTVFWSPNDSITLFYGDNKSTKLISDNVTPAIQTTFNGTLEGFEPNGTDEFWAIYPYSPDNTFDGSAVTFTLSGEQYWSGDFVCIAHSKDYTLQFYNVCGGVKFSVDRRGIQYVTFRGNNNEVLAGTVQATFDDSERPVVSDILEGETELCLYAPDGGFEVGQWYYMASLPATLSAGYTITFYKNQEVVSERTVDTPVTIKRSALGRLTSADNRDGLLVVNNYLTFESEGTTTISMYNYSGDRPVLYVSTDKTHWTLWDQNEITFDSNAPLYMCGDNPDGINPGNNTTVFVSSGDLFSIHGSIMSLLDMETELTVIPSDYCFYGLFYNCQQLVEGPSLPATTLTDGCYNQMFRGCTSLTTAPELPATMLTDGCYREMFRGCTNLNTAPELPATTMARFSYFGMFYDCSSLTMAPELPATELAERSYCKMFYNCINLTDVPSVLPATSLSTDCYGNMFMGCTSLTTAPELPATELADSCYIGMFVDCTSLTTVPSILPAASLATRCYAGMFNRCSSLSTAPELPATALAYACYELMFNGCSSLTVAPELPATEVADSCYIGMFVDCTSLTAVPSVLPATSLATSCYSSMFSGCSSLATAPELPATELADRCYFCMFKGCSNLTTAPDILPATTMYKECYRGMFYECSSLIKSPNLPATKVAVYCYGKMFYNCTNLVDVPSILPATTVLSNSYGNMFWGCTSLTTAPELPATEVADSCYMGMFVDCTSLTTVPNVLPATSLAKECYAGMFNRCSNLTIAPELPATVLAEGCYKLMFNGCFGLSAAPELPATVLAEACYNWMFNGCSSLSAAPDLPATALVDSCYYRMFNSCPNLEKVTCMATDISANGCIDDWLYGVASQGTFVKSGIMNNWPQGTSGIPEGWSVENAGEMSIADVYDAEDGAAVYLDNVLVYAVSTVSFVVGDDNAENFVNIYHAGIPTMSFSKGDRVSVLGTMKTYAGVPEVESIDGIVVNSSNNPLGEPEYIDYEIIKNGQYNKVTPVIATGLSVQRGNDSSHYFFLYTWENIAERQSPPVFLYWTTPQFDQFSDQYLTVSGFWLFRDSSSPLVQDRLDNILIDAVEPADAPYQTASILDVLNGSDGEYYKVTGTISQVANTNYGNVYLTDDSTQQTLYIYGMKNMIGSYPKDVDPDAIGFWETFPSLSENMVITVLGVRSTYNNTIELVDATLIYSASQ